MSWIDSVITLLTEAYQTPSTTQKVSTTMLNCGDTKMSKKFVVMPSFPPDQVNIMPGRDSFETETGVIVEYYYNVVNSTLEVQIPGNAYPGSLSPELGVSDLNEMIDFLTVVRDHMIEVNGV